MTHYQHAKALRNLTICTCNLRKSATSAEPCRAQWQLAQLLQHRPMLQISRRITSSPSYCTLFIYYVDNDCRVKMVQLWPTLCIFWSYIWRHLDQWNPVRQLSAALGAGLDSCLQHVVEPMYKCKLTQNNFPLGFSPRNSSRKQTNFSTCELDVANHKSTSAKYRCNDS